MAEEACPSSLHSSFWSIADSAQTFPEQSSQLLAEATITGSEIFEPGHDHRRGLMTPTHPKGEERCFSKKKISENCIYES